MNYKLLYEKIIERSKNRNCLNGYFETHHILPKSLGGDNDKTNLVNLTAREHFICHWLLVKMFDKGTKERNKMLYAFWIMKSNSDDNGKRYRNSRAYECLRIEYSKLVSNTMSVNQKGDKNSQYGKHWFTDLRTGESKSFFEKPDEYWVEGRNWFYNSSKELYSIKTKQRIYDVKGHLKSDRKEKQKEEILKLWNKFLESDFDSVIQFNKFECPTRNLHSLFRKYIPDYKKYKANLTKFVKCPLV